MNTAVLKKLQSKTLFLVMAAFVMSMLFAIPSAFAQNDGAGRGANGGDGGSIGEGISAFERETDLGKKDVRDTVAQLINMVIGFLAIVTVIIMLYGGFRWMTAAGNDDAVAQAKKIITAGIIGLVIVLASWSLAKFALVKIGQATNVSGAEDLDF